MSDASTPGTGRPTRVVIDASVVIKWHVAEPQSAEALRLLAPTPLEIHAPDLLFAEVANVLWKKCRRGELEPDAAREVLRLVTLMPVRTHPSARLVPAAFDIAVRAGRTAYDSL